MGKQITKWHFYKYRLPHIHLFRAGFIPNHLRGHPCYRPSKGHLGTFITKFFTCAKVRYLEHIICTYQDTVTREKNVKGAQEPKATTIEAYPSFFMMKHAWEYCYSPLDGMLVHCRVNPQQYITSTHLLSWVKRDKVE